MPAAACQVQIRKQKHKESRDASYYENSRLGDNHTAGQPSQSMCTKGAHSTSSRVSWLAVWAAEGLVQTKTAILCGC